MVALISLQLQDKNRHRHMAVSSRPQQVLMIRKPKHPASSRQQTPMNHPRTNLTNQMKRIVLNKA
jgi:hypothetical protein